MKALEIYKIWNKELEEQIETLLENGPTPTINYRDRAPRKARRAYAVLDKKLQ